MEYKNVRQAKFLARPNRFVAKIEIGGKTEICHIKNTGRCQELLIPGATVYVQESNNHKRKTKYDLISVYKGQRLINLDSQAPNKVFYRWMLANDLFQEITFIKPECRYKSSRFDFYVETATKKIYIEVKGVTLEENGIALFPDAPTERGIKHITDLCQSLGEGYEAYLVFIIQMEDVLFFMPNKRTHQAFGDALVRAEKQGVKIRALDCAVTRTSLRARNSVDVKL